MLDFSLALPRLPSRGPPIKRRAAAEIRRYSAAPLLLFIPGLVAVIAVAQALRPHPHDVDTKAD